MRKPSSLCCLLVMSSMMLLSVSAMARAKKSMCNSLQITLHVKGDHTCKLWMSAIEGVVTKESLDGILTLTNQPKTLVLNPDYATTLNGEQNPLQARLLYMCDDHQDPIIIESVQQGIRKNVFSTPKPGKISGQSNTSDATFSSKIGVCKASRRRAGAIDWAIGY